MLGGGTLPHRQLVPADGGGALCPTVSWFLLMVGGGTLPHHQLVPADGRGHSAPWLKELRGAPLYEPQQSVWTRGRGPPPLTCAVTWSLVQDDHVQPGDEVHPGPHRPRRQADGQAAAEGGGGGAEEEERQRQQAVLTAVPPQGEPQDGDPEEEGAAGQGATAAGPGTAGCCSPPQAGVELCGALWSSVEPQVQSALH